MIHKLLLFFTQITCFMLQLFTPIKSIGKYIQ